MTSATPVGVPRKTCPECGTECLAGESACWRCGASLDHKPEADALIDFAASPSPTDQPPASPRTVIRTTLTGEQVEVPDLSEAPPPFTQDLAQPAATGPPDGTAPDAKPAAPVFRLTYCKTCGIQNDEGATVCRKCREPLPVLTEPVPDIEPLRRTWGFDLLGLAWVALGVAAVYCGRFIVRTQPGHPGITWPDYFWTGIVVCAPGVLIFMRHYFCKFLFWVMAFSSILVWSVIGFIWLYVGLHVSENGSVGLAWLAALSLLSLISYATVRLNDEFDFGS